ncbi:zinc finger protein 510-like isoform X4 [Sparus aurata]|uniref:zinc finger protein 510-like isoform X4 n=1 Tax=Sparus aurata TaxID=8175 RepID=UPI0011C1B2E0|nr:zinc finger protein 510-like isoform X4 [Sparus aurata]
MSKVQTLRVFGKQRLTAAAEEIFELFERTIAEYEEELCRQRKLLDAVLQPQVQLHRTDVQQLLGSKEAVPLEQSSLDQEDPPELPHIKEEQEELWTRQEGEQLPGLEEADITKFTFGAEQTVNPAHIRVSRQFLTECFWRKSLCESVKMSKVQTLRVFGKQKLTAAAEEIFELFERTIAEYEEELCRQRKLLDAVFQPQVQLHRTDVQQLLGSEEEDPPEQQEWNSSLDQEDPPELPHIKEEQEELWINQEGEQLRGLDEADITKFTFTPVPVKSEDDDEERPQSSQLHPRQTVFEIRDAKHWTTEPDVQVCGGPKSARNFNPDRRVQPATCDETSHSFEPDIDDVIDPELDHDASEAETDDSYEWIGTRGPHSGLNSLQQNEVPGSDDMGETSVSSSECARSFGYERHLQKHNGVQTEEKPFSCSVCGKSYHKKNSLRAHMNLHSGAERFSCPLCEKTFQWKRNVETHMTIHTGEKPFCCSVCGTTFAQSSTLRAHLKVHTGEKPYACSICKASFGLSSNFYKHMRMHNGEKPFTCSVCGKGFGEGGHLKKHMTVHTGEKRFGCSVCGKSFAQHGTLRRHLITHTGEKPFSCSVCNKRFTRRHILNKHKCVGEGSRNK